MEYNLFYYNKRLSRLYEKDFNIIYSRDKKKAYK